MTVAGTTLLMSKNITERRFADRGQAAEQLATDLADIAGSAIDESGRASLVFSGGSTPGPMLELFSQKQLDWKHVYVSLSDERRVAPDHELSNELMLRNALLQGPATAINFTSLHGASVEQRLQQFPRPIDAVVLGMGVDGHTASLFPGHHDLENVHRSSALSVDVGGPDLDPARTTLTPAALLDSKLIVLLFFGNKKWVVYESAKTGKNVSQYPVRCVLNQSDVPVTVYWAP